MGDGRGAAQARIGNIRRGSIFAPAAIWALLTLLGTGAQAQVKTQVLPARAKAQIVQPINPASRVILRGNTPLFARAENDRGPAPDGLILNRILLVLKRPAEQEAALRKLLVAQQVKSSSNYHQWLTPEQFGDQFGPADADIQTVREWLSSQGFQIDRVPAGRSVIEFSGTAANVQAAFHTGIHQYVVNGSAYWSNAADPQIPAALAPAVVGIASLNNFPIKPTSHRAGFPVHITRAAGPIPLYNFKAPNGSIFHAVAPGDFNTIYNVPPSINGAPDGAGQMIAIVSASNVNLQDDSAFKGLFALPGPAPNVILNGPDPGIVPGYESEADLDIEWAGAIAPAATIDLVVSQDTVSTPGINLSALYIVDNDLAPVMSVSYGYCESTLGAAGNAFYNSLWDQAAAEGISVIVAAGDEGSAACNNPGVNYEYVSGGLAVSGVASTPFDVAVGGTDFDDASDPSPYWNSTSTTSNYSSALSYIPEITWNNSCAQVGDSASCGPAIDTPEGVLAGGGGPSSCVVFTESGPTPTCDGGYPKPVWQSGPGVPSDGVRDIPDVSLFAADGRNGSFYIYCEADANPDSSTNCASGDSSDVQPISGTSVSAQAFAGIMALIDQKAGGRQGNPNFILYTLAARSGASCASNPAAVKNASCIFYDIINGNNSLPCSYNSVVCPNTGGVGSPSMLIVPGSNPEIPAWTTGPGYDYATGLGSVNVANLISQWSSVSFTPSTVTLSVSPTTLTHGQPSTVNIQVTAQGGTPTGLVSLLGGSGSNPSTGSAGIAAFTLSNGAASGAVTSFPGGTYNIAAHYAGDGTYGASDSNPVQVTVGKENSATTLGIETEDQNGNVLSPNANLFPYGSFYVLNVEVENSAGNACGANQVPAIVCPSGRINLTDNGAPLDSSVNTLNSVGVMQDNLIQLTVGPHALAASYLGDNSFNPSVSPTDQVTVTQAATYLNFTAGVGGVDAGSTDLLTVAVETQSTGVPPTGTIQFMNGSTPINGSITYSAAPNATSGLAQLTATLSFVPTSSFEVTAQYSGDANYLPSSAGQQDIELLPVFALSISPPSLTIPAGQTASATAAITTSSGFNSPITLECQLPVTLTEATCSVTPLVLSAAGQATITITTTAAQAIVAPSSRWFASPGNHLVLLSLFLLALLPLIISARSSSPRRHARRILAALVLALLLASCGGGGGQSSAPYTPPPNPGTSAGTYTATITAASGTSSHEASLTVVVQ